LANYVAIVSWLVIIVHGNIVYRDVKLF